MHLIKVTLRQYQCREHCQVPEFLPSFFCGKIESLLSGKFQMGAGHIHKEVTFMVRIPWSEQMCPELNAKTHFLRSSARLLFLGITLEKVPI